MGNYFSGWREADEQKISKKRPHEEIDSETDSDSDPEYLHTPKRKKLQTTSKYIFETLFINGQNSDVTISALGKNWNLHKVYLCQSGYFSSMFSGSWRESNATMINIDIPDDTIDVEALTVTLGSLYRDDVLISPSRVVSILAAATLLQLDGLINQCADIMTETTSAKTVCAYHAAATAYGLTDVASKCISWLERNVMLAQSVSFLRELSLELMEILTKSSNLFVLQVEMDVYTMVKKWVFLKLVPSWNGSLKQLNADSDAFYRSFGPGELLLSDRGKPYVQVFNGVRYQHVINDFNSTRLLDRDRIIPQEWLLPIYKNQWQCMLAVELGTDKGPTNDHLSIESLCKHGMRCGRIINKDGDYCWRWTGYNYGLDLLIMFSNRLIVCKRNTVSHPVVNSVSLVPKRSVMFRVCVVSYDSMGQIRYEKNSGLFKVNLGKDQETVVMGVDRHVPFPLQVSFNVACITPKEGEPISLAIPKEISQANEDTVSQSNEDTVGQSNVDKVNQSNVDKVDLTDDDVSDATGANDVFM
ncbi:germ cell-less protein-like 1 [Glandiceps talaboti]